MNKIFKFSTYILLLLLISFLAYFIFNPDLRRKLLTYSFVTHDYYQLKRLTTDLQERNFYNISIKIEEYINISKKFSDEKSFMLPGIYEVLELAVSRAVEQDDYNYLEKSLIEIVKMDKNLYKPKVWLARALSDNNPDESINLLEKAIALSPTQEDAYRELIKISYDNDNLDLVKKYCNIYPTSQVGGNQDPDFGSFFGSYNLKKFAIKFNNKNNDDNYYYNSGIELGDFNKYEFIPLEPLDIEGLNLYFSFLPGINIKIKDITLYSNNNKIIIPSNELMFSSKSSYIINDNNLSFLSLNESDEIIRLKFLNYSESLNNSIYKSVDKIEIFLSIKKLNLTNNNICK